MCQHLKRTRSPSSDMVRSSKTRRNVALSPSGVEQLEQHDDDDELATPTHRDEMVAAILTIASALGLAKETLHICVDLLDRYMQQQPLQCSQLEPVSIACLWIAVKFMETPTTMATKAIKCILKRRRHSGNWTWSEIIALESTILQKLDFRIMAPSVLRLVQQQIHAAKDTLAPHKVQLAYYFADLCLLKSRMSQYPNELVVQAIWYILSEHRINEVQKPLLAPVVILFLAHRDNIDPNHAVHRTWFALRCQYGPFLQAPWRLPYDPECICRVCQNVQQAMTENDDAC